MAGQARRSFCIPSRFLFTPRVSSSCSGVEALDPPPIVRSRRVVVTGKHSMCLYVCGCGFIFELGSLLLFFIFIFYWWGSDGFSGLGMVTPLGCGVDTTWKRLILGDCGIRALSPEDLKMDNFDRETQMHAYEQLTSKVAAIVPSGTNPGDFNVDLWLNSKVNMKHIASVHY